MYFTYCCIISSSLKKPHNKEKNNLHEKQVNEYYCTIDSEINVAKKRRGKQLKAKNRKSKSKKKRSKNAMAIW